MNLIITPASATSVSINLNKKWNLITGPSTTDTVKEWCIDLGAKEIIRKNTVTGEYEEYVYNYSSDDNDYDIDPSRGYFVYMDSASTYTYTSLSTRAVSLVGNWNIIGVGADVQASAILAMADSIKSVVKRNADGSFSTYNSEVPTSDFTIEQGYACYIYTSNPTAIRT